MFALGRYFRQCVGTDVLGERVLLRPRPIPDVVPGSLRMPALVVVARAESLGGKNLPMMGEDANQTAKPAAIPMRRAGMKGMMMAIPELTMRLQGVRTSAR